MKYNPSLTETGMNHARRLQYVLFRTNGIAIKMAFGTFLFGELLNAVNEHSPIAQTAHFAGFVSGGITGLCFKRWGIPGLAFAAVAQVAGSIGLLWNPVWNYRYNAWKAVEEFSAGNWFLAENYLENILLFSRSEDKWATALLALTLSQIPEKREEAAKLADSIDIARDLPTAETLRMLKETSKKQNFTKQIQTLKL
jgi:hypothetical protein